MKPKSALLLPPTELSGGLFAAIHRDTRGLGMSDRDRFNFFPASPLVAVTYVAEGELRLVPQDGGLDDARSAPALPRLSVMLPSQLPTVSWSPGTVRATTVGVYPDAWEGLSRRCDASTLLLSACEGCDDVGISWERFCTTLQPAWRATRQNSNLPNWTGAPPLAEWSRALITRAALAGPGRSVRALERRLKRWSGQTRRSLDFFASFDRLHRLSAQAGETPLAVLALEAGYSDQSHMGRALRRATGFSPAELNRRIDTEEAFWCYRLLGESF